MKVNSSKFNLIDDAWIPLSDGNIYGLKDTFSRKKTLSLIRSGTSFETESILFFLQMICQASVTPCNISHWESIGPSGMCNLVLRFLRRWHCYFNLQGEKSIFTFMEMSFPTISIRHYKKTEVKKSEEVITLLTDVYSFVKNEVVSHECNVNRISKKRSILSVRNPVSVFYFFQKSVFFYNSASLQQLLWSNLYTRDELCLFIN